MSNYKHTNMTPYTSLDHVLYYRILRALVCEVTFLPASLNMFLAGLHDRSSLSLGTVSSIPRSSRPYLRDISEIAFKIYFLNIFFAPE